MQCLHVDIIRTDITSVGLGTITYNPFICCNGYVTWAAANNLQLTHNAVQSTVNEPTEKEMIYPVQSTPHPGTGKVNNIRYAAKDMT